LPLQTVVFETESQMKLFNSNDHNIKKYLNTANMSAYFILASGDKVSRALIYLSIISPFIVLFIQFT